MSKKSIRFYNDREVRAVWDESNSKWWFSAIDIVRAINNEDDYKKCRNYWKYLKGKMAKDGIELVPNNPAYAPMFFSNQEMTSKPVKILGKLIMEDGAISLAGRAVYQSVHN